MYEKSSRYCARFSKLGFPFSITGPFDMGVWGTGFAAGTLLISFASFVFFAAGALVDEGFGLGCVDGVPEAA